ncbi:hypothetical protein [Leptospira bandrabouensis]|uniref:GyrI-like small molecule binding domain protein n=1 Tax=Leptospira bandrabouensis TaxID=2484903 RepID=A0A6H3NWE7_9LEPT|nr:hypothetical protein [Leptospira bandrabouensis]MCG6153682.1 hypothetical protein [Leptospira bandrabouensis]MCW7458557.1 hypothetical protein [Leptospira bandrabouensis]MCW7478696.1 hypothetical protein [Leptospira bandrabouensis]MCW7486640.1 hypothetical protein [Leptospira bandrabouensis]TGN05765.1 hypothetical protein EHR07_14535 [Leptospira bandrabouensis]
MKKGKSIGIAIAILVLFGVAFYSYMGGFQQVSVIRESFGPTEIYYVTHKGPYKEIGNSWDRFQKEWESVGITNCDSLAIYLDGPDTEPSKLRSILGCRLDGLSPEQKKQVSLKFKTFFIPKMNGLSANFPFKNFISYFLAPTKVYPKFQEILIAEPSQTSVAIEIYGGSSQSVNSIGFFMPLGVNREIFKSLEDAFQ